MRRNKCISVMLAIMLLVGCVGCGRQETATDRYFRIGVVEYNALDTFISALVDCFQEDIRELQMDGQSISVMVKDAAGSQRTQNSCVEDLIDGGCDLLCVNLVDRAASSTIIDMAIDQNIPVIFFNREPVREDLLQGDQLYYVGADAQESGVMQGELAAEALANNPAADRNKDGKIQFVMMQGESGHQDAIIRTENAVATIGSKGIELEKLSYSIANWSRAQAMTRMMQLITQYGRSIELVLANNDDMALGTIDAYVAKNITEADRPVVLGTDGTAVGLAAVQNGVMAATVYNDKEGQARAMAELAVTLLRGGDLSEFQFTDDRCIYLPYAKVTPENVQSFMNR